MVNSTSRRHWTYFVGEPLLLISLLLVLPFTLCALLVYAVTGQWIWSAT